MALKRCANAPIMGHGTMDAIQKCPICSAELRKMAGLPALKPQSMAKVQSSASMRAIYEDPNSTPDDLRAAAEAIMANNIKSSDLREVAAHPNLPIEVMMDVFRDGEYEAIEGVLKNPNVPVEILEEVVGSGDYYARTRGMALIHPKYRSKENWLRAIRDKSLPGSVLNSLGGELVDEEVASALLSRDDAFTESTIAYNLCEHHDEGIARAAAEYIHRDLMAGKVVRNQRTSMGSGQSVIPLWTTQEVAELLDRYPKTNDLEAATGGISMRLLMSKAREGLPESAMRRAYDSDYASSFSDSLWMRSDVPESFFDKEYNRPNGMLPDPMRLRMMLSSPSCPERLYDAVIMDREDGLNRLSNEDIASIIGNKMLPERAFRKLEAEYSKKKEVKEALAKSPRTETARLSRFAAAKDRNLALAAIDNPSLPDEALRKAQSGSHFFRANLAAKKRIAARFDIDEDNDEALDFLASEDWTRLTRDSNEFVIASTMFQSREV